MTSGRPAAVPRTSYQIVAPFAWNLFPGPSGAAGFAAAGRGVVNAAIAASETSRVAASVRAAAGGMTRRGRGARFIGVSQVGGCAAPRARERGVERRPRSLGERPGSVQGTLLGSDRLCPGPFQVVLEPG